MEHALEFGLDTFGDVTVDAEGNRLSGAEVIRNVVEQAVLADQLGVDAFGVGEHHRDDFAVTAPEVVLAAIAARTTRIKLGTAVTVLSSDDPIRVYERFATLDAISNGRAEITLGRGSFTESFPLFGYDLGGLREALRARSSTCSRRCARRSRSPGRARPARRSRTPTSTRRPATDRLRRGSASAAHPSRSFAPRATGSR